MSQGTRPLGWLFNFFCRKPQGQPYELLESVQPTIDTAIEWPITLTPYVNAIATGAGNNQVDITTPPEKHRLWVFGGWASPDALVYAPAAEGSFSMVLLINQANFPPVYFWMRLTNNGAEQSFKPPDEINFMGTQGGAFNFSDLTTAGHEGSGFYFQRCGNIYQPPNSTLRFLWTNQTAGKTITFRGVYIEKDASSPILWPF